MTGLRVALALVGSLPWARSLAGPWLGQSTRVAVDLAFAALCHHAPDRTLDLLDGPMCVCSRCAGLYLGVVLAASLPWRLSVARLRTAFPLALGAMLADVLSQDAGMHPPWHPVRLATGLVVGWLSASWMIGHIERDLRDSTRQSAIVAP